MADQITFGQNSSAPLAARLRPQTLDEFVGQTHLLGKGKILRNLIENDRISSMIFWGPPGVGKTTLARIIANQTKAEFIDFSAVTSGIKEIRSVMQQADENRIYGTRTIVFVDEIHRFNKAQQDAFLPFVEKGSIILIGATTENPSFEVNGALLSRCKVFVLKALESDELVTLLARAIKDSRGFGEMEIQIEPDMLKAIANFANGDARSALSTLEMVVLNGETNGNTVKITPETLEQCISKKSLLYDKNGEEHYNLISALHKSMRNSDPDAAVYWLERMLEGGEDPLYIARRVIRFSSEDIGMADPKALQIAVAAYQACHFIGMPECCACRPLYVSCAEIQCRLHCRRKGKTRCAQQTKRTCAAGDPKRADETDERTGLRQGLSIRARRRGKTDRYAVPAGFTDRHRILHAYRTGSGREIQSATGTDQGMEKAAHESRINSAVQKKRPLTFS